MADGQDTVNTEELWDRLVPEDSTSQGDTDTTPVSDASAGGTPSAGTEKDPLDDDALWSRIQEHPRLKNALSQYTEQIGSARDQQWVEYAHQLGLTEELQKRNEAFAKGDKFWEKAKAAGTKAGEASQQAADLHAEAARTGDPRIEALARKVDGVAAYLAKQAQMSAQQAKQASQNAVINDVQKAISAVIPNAQARDPEFRANAQAFILRRANEDLKTKGVKGIKDFKSYAAEYPQYVQRVYGVSAGHKVVTSAPTVVPGETPEQRRSRLEKEITARLVRED